MPSEAATVLTPRHLHLLFGGTQLNPKTSGFSALEGKISIQSKGQDKSLHVYVTRTLNKDQWAKLLTESRNHGVILHVQCAEGVMLPTELVPAVNSAVVFEAKEATPWTNKVKLAPTQVITSTDVDTTVALLKREEKWDMRLDISELDVADLLTRVHIPKSPDGKNIFREKECALLTGLKAGKNILLTGRCSPTLADQLAPLLIQRFQAAESGHQPTGRLCIVTQPPATTVSSPPFQYLPSQYQYQHSVTPAEKLDCLRNHQGVMEESKEAGGDIEAKLSKFLDEPLAKLQARYDFLRKFPEAKADESSKAWNNLYRLPGFLTEPPPFNPDNAQQEVDAFYAARKKAVDAALKRNPYVLLLGFSGVGKTTFVHGLKTENDSLEIVGEDLEKSLRAWKNSEAKGKKRLFIDEATLHPSDWTRFESLFHEPPGMLIDGEYFEFPPRSDFSESDYPYEVVFAGNPVSYSDDRKAASLFERHGSTVVFDPLPPAVLYVDVLQPLFENQQLAPKEPKVIEEISAHLLEVYRFLVSCSKTDVLISPRELEMMALLTLSYCAHPKNSRRQIDPLSVAKHYAFTLAKNLVPEEFKAAFNTKFSDTPFQPLQTDRSGTFLITPSRESLCQKIDEWLALRTWRQENRVILTPKQLYGGLGGMTIEGEPRIGKSDLILDRLRSHGFRKGTSDDLNKPVVSGETEKIFYLMQPPTRDSLIKAFHQGAVVVIDEANSFPGMEDLLNSLLMGKTPENEPAVNPGFMVIYTQNPAKTTQGRRATSTASARRHYTEELFQYPRDEMEAVLLHKNLPPIQTRALLTAFERNTEKAIREKHALLPNFGDVLQEAEETLALLGKAVQLEPAPAPAVPTLSEQDLVTGIKGIVSSNSAGNTFGGVSLIAGSCGSFFAVNQVANYHNTLINLLVGNSQALMSQSASPTPVSPS